MNLLLHCNLMLCCAVLNRCVEKETEFVALQSQLREAQHSSQQLHTQLEDNKLTAAHKAAEVWV